MTMDVSRRSFLGGLLTVPAAAALPSTTRSDYDPYLSSDIGSPEGISPLKYGAAADAVTDDTAAVNAALTFAFANGLSVDGGDKLYAVSGTILVHKANRPHIRKLRLIQLAQGNEVKTLHFLNCQEVQIDRLVIRMGTNKTAGYMNSSGGLWVQGGSHHLISNIEITGHGKHSFVTFFSCLKSTFTNIMVHDNEFDAPGATDDLQQGIWLIYCQGCTLNNPSTYNMGGNAKWQGVTLANLRSRGLSLSGCDQIDIINARAENVDQAIDVSGDEGNTNITFHGGGAKDCASVGLKFSGSATQCAATGYVTLRCGAYGFLVNGSLPGGNAGLMTRDISFNNCHAYDSGAGGIFNTTTAGFLVQTATGAAGKFAFAPRGVNFNNCHAVDTQAVKTMMYGFYNNVPYDPTPGTFRPNTLTACQSSGASIKGEFGFHRPTCHLSGTGTVALTSNLAATIGWDTEIEDTMVMHSTASDTDEIVIGIPGVYQVEAKGVFAANSTGYRRLKLLKNNAPLLTVASPPAPGEATTVLMREELTFTTGDILKIGAEQLSGASVNFVRSSSYFKVSLVRAS